MIDIRQSPQYADYLKQIGWEVERISETNYFIKKLPLFGSIIKIQKPEEIKINKIRELAKKYQAFQIIVEPARYASASVAGGPKLISLGFKLSNSPYLPTKTLQLDLTKSEKQLLKEMKKDARASVHKNPKIQYTIYNIQNLEQFRNAWKKAVGWKRYVPPLSHLLALKKSFKENCLFLMTNNKSGGAIFLIGDKIGYYWQAFTSSEGRKKLYQYKIVWEGIKWARKKGVKIFDFEGIYDERFPNKTWLGFTHFKKSFGGYEVSYPGTFIKWFP